MTEQERWIADTQNWYRRYRWSPANARTHLRHWTRRLLGLHCLVDDGRGPGWFRYRCRRCGRRATVTLWWDEMRMRSDVEPGCPLTDRLIALEEGRRPRA